MSLENFNNFGGIKIASEFPEGSSSAERAIEENQSFKLKVEEYKEEDSIEQLFNNGNEESSLESFSDEAVEKSTSEPEDINVFNKKSFSLPIKEIQDEVPVSEERESNLDGITRGEKTRNENEKGGDERFLIKYMKELDDVEKETLNFLDKGWQ